MTTPRKRKKPSPTVAPDDYNPSADYIILEPELEPEVSEGGILIPEQARHFLNEGKILKKGPLVSDEYKVGMFVVFEAASEFRLELAKDIIVFVVKENAIILTRQDKQAKFFPAKTQTQEDTEHAREAYRRQSDNDLSTGHSPGGR